MSTLHFLCSCGTSVWAVNNAQARAAMQTLMELHAQEGEHEIRVWCLTTPEGVKEKRR